MEALAKFCRAACGLFLVRLSLGTAFAQNAPQPSLDASEPAAEFKRDKILYAHRITGTPPRIDGTPNDEVWSQAQAAEGLVQWNPTTATQ